MAGAGLLPRKEALEANSPASAKVAKQQPAFYPSWV